MERQSRSHPDAFREQIVELEASRPEVGEMAREFSLNSQSIHNWMKKAGRLADLPHGTAIIKAHRAAKAAVEQNALTGVESEELLRLPRENRQLKLERDILSKATA